MNVIFSRGSKFAFIILLLCINIYLNLQCNKYRDVISRWELIVSERDKYIQKLKSNILSNEELSLLCAEAENRNINMDWLFSIKDSLITEIAMGKHREKLIVYEVFSEESDTSLVFSFLDIGRKYNTKAIIILVGKPNSKILGKLELLKVQYYLLPNPILDLKGFRRNHIITLAGQRTHNLFVPVTVQSIDRYFSSMMMKAL